MFADSNPMKADLQSAGLSRREFLRGAAATAVAAACADASPSAALTPALRQPLEEFEYGAVQLTGGPLKAHYDRILASYLALDNNRLLKVYREHAGLPAPGAEMGGWYDSDGFVPGHSLGQYISGLARFGRATGSAACQAKVGELVEGFAATLGKDDRIFAGPNAIEVWPCYVLDKHLAGLIDAYRLSGITQARDLLGRVYHGALPYIPDQGRDRVGKKDPPFDETYILSENLFNAHEITGDRAILDRARAYLLDRDFFDPLARGQDVLPGRHAYSHAIALSSAAKAHLVLGDDKYLTAMKNAWEMLITAQQYATGGWGPNETFITPRKGELYASLQTTDDHFETPCGSYAAIKLARYLICATGNAKYGDHLERLTYNTILAAKDPDKDGDYPYYSTYSAGARKVYYQKKWPCCSGTLVQCVADYVKNLYFRAPDGIAVNLYAPSELRWAQRGSVLKITQETEAPIGGAVRLRIDCSHPTNFTLNLRIPSWSEGPASIQVNGTRVTPQIRNGFAALRRTWQTGDSITLTSNQNFQTEPIDELHLDTVALMRGPLVYVERNPHPETPHHAPIASLLPDVASAGVFSTRISGRERIYVPFYSVREEAYTMYSQKS
jgi:uncharacterized protein